MSWNAYDQCNKTGRFGKTCPVCGKHFFAHSHQKLCCECKKMVGKRRVTGRQV